MTSLSCKKFKRIFTLKQGHKGQFICIQKNIKSYRRPFLNKVNCPPFFIICLIEALPRKSLGTSGSSELATTCAPTFDWWHRNSSQANLRETCDDLHSRLIRALRCPVCHTTVTHNLYGDPSHQGQHPGTATTGGPANILLDNALTALQIISTVPFNSPKAIMWEIGKKLEI